MAFVRGGAYRWMEGAGLGDDHQLVPSEERDVGDAQLRRRRRIQHQRETYARPLAPTRMTSDLTQHVGGAWPAGDHPHQEIFGEPRRGEDLANDVGVRIGEDPRQEIERWIAGDRLPLAEGQRPAPAIVGEPFLALLTLVARERNFVGVVDGEPCARRLARL